MFAFIRYIVNWETGADHGLKHQHNVMTYLTTWTYLILTLHVLTAAVVAILYYCTLRSRLQTKTHATNIKMKSFSTQSVSFQNNSIYLFSFDSYNIHSNTESENKLFHKDNSDLKISNSYQIKPDNLASLHVQDPAIIDSGITWYLKLSWILWNIVSVDAIMVTAIYFGALYNKLQTERGHPGLDYDNFNVHALNTIVVLIDGVVGARPVRFLHVVYPVMYSVVYIMFSVIYWCYDHSNVLYKGVLDWNKPSFTTGVVVIVTFVLLPVLQCCHFALYRLRLFIYKRIYGTDY